MALQSVPLSHNLGFLLLHVGVGQILSVDDHVGMVGGLERKASVADAAAMAFLLVDLHDVLQVFLPTAEGELQAHRVEAADSLPSLGISVTLLSPDTMGGPVTHGGMVTRMGQKLGCWKLRP